ncbi:MAG TPA: hypothetical protein VEC36_10675 [Patescibacteria group bacterium]|nr:hypothetical protein [Patescibacteria group bacterium]
MNYIFRDYVIQQGGNFVQLGGNKVPGVPQHLFFSGLSYDHASGLMAEITSQFSGEYFTNDVNSPNFNNEHYVTVDARLGFLQTFDYFSFNIFGGINNIFDKKYNSSIIPNAAGNRFFEPAPGRNWYVSVEIPYSPFSFFTRENAY